MFILLFVELIGLIFRYGTCFHKTPIIYFTLTSFMLILHTTLFQVILEDGVVVEVVVLYDCEDATDM